MQASLLFGIKLMEALVRIQEQDAAVRKARHHWLFPESKSLANKLLSLMEIWNGTSDLSLPFARKPNASRSVESSSHRHGFVPPQLELECSAVKITERTPREETAQILHTTRKGRHPPRHDSCEDLPVLSAKQRKDRALAQIAESRMRSSGGAALDRGCAAAGEPLCGPLQHRFACTAPSAT